MTQIQLIGDVAGYINLTQDIDLPLTLAISDFRDITKRNGFFSKTITIPGNHVNNKLLGYYFDVNITNSSYNVNRVQECIILENGIPLLSNCFIQLISVRKRQNIVNGDDIIEYDLLIKNTVSSFFTAISNKNLDDLPSEAFNLYNIDNFFSETIIDSFNNQWSDDSLPNYKPWKYFLPYTDSRTYDTKELAPLISAKFYWDLIHSTAGYKYQWDNLDNRLVRFDKLYISSNKDKKETIDIINNFNSVNARMRYDNSEITLNGNNAIATYTTSDYFYVNLYLPREIDPASLWYTYPLGSVPSGLTPYNTQSFGALGGLDFATSPIANDWGASKFISDKVFNPGILSINLILDWEFSIENNHSVDLESPNHAPGTSAITTGTNRPRFDIKLHVYNVTQNSDNVTGIASLYPNEVYYPASSTTKLFDGKMSITVNMSATTFNIGDEITFFLEVKPNPSVYAYNVNFVEIGTNTHYGVKQFLKIREAELNINCLDIPFGAEVPLNTYIPKNIKQSEFIKSISTIFNLYCVVDKNDDTNIIWKQRDIFYDEGITLDWSGKQDKSQFQEVKFIPELTSKEFLMTYKPDSDGANQVYTDSVKKIYGQQKIIFSSEWIKNIETKEIIFSPTPMKVSEWGGICPDFSNNYGARNVRILLDSGTVSGETDTFFIRDYTDPIGPTSVGTTSISYPILTHSTGTYNPNYDINFGVCDYYYVYGYVPTDNNLYNLNWARTINQLNNGKILTAYFNLNALDIANLNMNEKIWCAGSIWNINQIIDYNPNKKELTKVELISIDNFNL